MTGATLASKMIVVTCWGLDSLPLVTLIISTITVSFDSSIESLVAVILVVPVKLPAVITIEAGTAE